MRLLWYFHTDVALQKHIRRTPTLVSNSLPADGFLTSSALKQKFTSTTVGGVRRMNASAV